MSANTELFQKFESYLRRPVAEKAASPLNDGVAIELRVIEPDGRSVETFTFTRENKLNRVVAQGSRNPEVVFTLTQGAVDELFAHPSDDVAQTGVQIAKMVFSKDPGIKVNVKLHAGFLTLWSRGYLGVVSSAGGEFTRYLATRGFSGMDAIKTALKGRKG